MKTRIIFALLLGLVLLLGTFVRSAAQGQADPPSPPREASASMIITYQGRLTDKNGAPLNKAVNVVFKLYDSSDVLRWTSAVRSITPVNGLFTVYLGESPDPAISSLPAYFYKSIGVTVGSDPEMTPRQPFSSVIGYAQSGIGVLGSSAGSFGVRGLSNNSPAVYGTSTNSFGVLGEGTLNAGVFGHSVSGAGVSGSSDSNAGVTGFSTDLYGVEGSSENAIGVRGSSTDSYGVEGTSVNSWGVHGISTNTFGVRGDSQAYIGVYALTQSGSYAALRAQNLNNGPAIDIMGGIEVPAAGVNTTTPVFMHKVITGASGNICPAPNSDHITVINNPMTNGRPNAILIVTPNYRSSDGSNANLAGPAKDIPAVSYVVGGMCGVANNNRWVIYNLNSSPMVNNTYYNVMVIWP